MIILGVDPGTARLGWGIIKTSNNRSLALGYGCLKTQSVSSDAHRLAILFKGFNRLLSHYRPEAVAVESIFFFKNKTTIIQVSQARGVILLASHLKKISVFSYSPPQIKLAVSGYGRADKNQVQQMTKVILKLDSIPKPDDTADALAVALTHSFSYKLKGQVLRT